MVNSAPSASGGRSCFRRASSTAVSTAIQAVNAADPASPVSVTLDLNGASTAPTTAFDAPTSVQMVLTSSGGAAIVQGATVSGGTVIVAASVTPSNWLVTGGECHLQGPPRRDLTVTGGTVTLADGTVITGNSPAITVNGGTVILKGVTAQTATNYSTIVVNGGGSTDRPEQHDRGARAVLAQAAILITGGASTSAPLLTPGVTSSTSMVPASWSKIHLGSCPTSATRSK